jgi:hypothetical protein
LTASDGSLSEATLAQDHLEDLLALVEDLAPMGDEEETVARQLPSETPVVERGNDRLAGARRRDHEVARVSVRALCGEVFEDLSLMRSQKPSLVR